MGITEIIWKIAYLTHIISNASFLGINLVFFIGCEKICIEGIVKRFFKIMSIAFAFSGLSGIVMLSILSMGGMDNLFSNPVGLAILSMIISYLIVLFVLIFFLLYKGGDAKIYRWMVGIMLFFYFLNYVVVVVLTK